MREKDWYETIKGKRKRLSRKTAEGCPLGANFQGIEKQESSRDHMTKDYNRDCNGLAVFFPVLHGNLSNDICPLTRFVILANK